MITEQQLINICITLAVGCILWIEFIIIELFEKKESKQ